MEMLYPLKYVSISVIPSIVSIPAFQSSDDDSGKIVTAYQETLLSWAESVIVVRWWANHLTSVHVLCLTYG